MIQKLNFEQAIEQKSAVRPTNPVLLFVVTAISVTWILESMVLHFGV